MRMKKEINIQIGEQIKAAREQSKLTQEQFAERIDVHHSMYQIWSVVLWVPLLQH